MSIPPSVCPSVCSGGTEYEFVSWLPTSPAPGRGFVKVEDAVEPTDCGDDKGEREGKCSGVRKHCSQSKKFSSSFCSLPLQYKIPQGCWSLSRAASRSTTNFFRTNMERCPASVAHHHGDSTQKAVKQRFLVSSSSPLGRKNLLGPVATYELSPRMCIPPVVLDSDQLDLWRNLCQGPVYSIRPAIAGAASRPGQQPQGQQRIVLPVRRD